MFIGGVKHGFLKGGLTNELTGAGARRAEGTNTGHENGEAMASVGVHVEHTVRLGIFAKHSMALLWRRWFNCIVCLKEALYFCWIRPKILKVHKRLLRISLTHVGLYLC